MESAVKALVRAHFHRNTVRVTALGGGFYGRVFLAELPDEPFQVVFKLYLFPGLAQKEATQLRTLKQAATLSMPEVYFIDTTKAVSPYDSLAMSFLSGFNAGDLHAEALSPTARNTIAEEIIKNLLAYHSVLHPQGFGPLDAEAFTPDWREYYRPIARAALSKAQALSEQELLPPVVPAVMERAMESYDCILYLPITEARLIHGDYNTWNIMVNPEQTHAVAVFDPFNCCWADREFDLYQLDNANGREFRLLERYAEQQPLSENFPLKRCFYELFTEVSHYYDAHIDPRQSGIPGQADALAQAMDKKGIC